MQLPSQVVVTDVGPRDGLQSLGRVIPTEVKASMVEALVHGGFRSIEVTSFMRPDVVPELADAEKLMAILPREPGVDYRALVPNVRGASRAIDAGIDTLVALMTATDSYSRKNQGRDTAALVQQVLETIAYGEERGIPVEVAIGMAFFDPYEGNTPSERVLDVVDRVAEGGAKGVYLANSVGMANPLEVHTLCSAVKRRHPELPLALHLHNTNGMGLANALAGLLAGVSRFEGSICGLGGGIRMPAGLSAFGNLATEDLVHMFTEMDIDCGLSLDPVLAASKQVEEMLDVQSCSPASRGATKASVLRLSGQQESNASYALPSGS